MRTPTNLKKDVSLFQHRNAKYDLICDLADAIELQDGIFQWKEIEIEEKFNVKAFKNFLWVVLAGGAFLVAFFTLL